MKNKEKYKDKIFEIACTGRRVAVSKKGRPIACVDCDLCMYISDKNCADTFSEWCEAEYIEKPTLTNNERKFLEIIDPKWKYIARDANKNLYVFDSLPSKKRNSWYIESVSVLICNYCNISENLFGKMFDFIKWEDEEPWLIEDLKKLEIKEDTND